MPTRVLRASRYQPEMRLRYLADAIDNIEYDAHAMPAEWTQRAPQALSVCSKLLELAI